MRPYRGKRKDNGEWVYGWYVYNEISGNTYIYEKKGAIWEVHPSTVGQSTGIIVKNGEVYKSDLIKVIDEIYEVVWHFNRWVMKGVKTRRVKEFKQIDLGFYEIIGTVHDKQEEK